MVEVRHLTIDNIIYYYLFHYETINNKFHKYKRYLGTELPSKEHLKIIKEHFLKNLPKHKINKNTIELLQDIQDKEGYISKESFIKLSKETDIPLIELTGIATFYSDFKLQKQGKYKIKVCNGTACNVKKSPIIIDAVKELLNIKPGQLSKDEKFSFEIVNCIGACARAPAMMINETVYGELTKDKVKEIIGKLK